MRGYTLVELMFTIALVAVLALVTVPPVMRALERREAANAAQFTLDIVEFAKVQSAARNKAYYIVPSLSEFKAGKNGSVTVNEGASSACTDAPAGHIQGVRGFDVAGSYPFVNLVATTPSSLPQDAICVKPDGRVLNASTQLPFASGNNLYEAGEARIEFLRYSKGLAEGPRHIVVVPFNGAARLEFK